MWQKRTREGLDPSEKNLTTFWKSFGFTNKKIYNNLICRLFFLIQFNSISSNAQWCVHKLHSRLRHRIYIYKFIFWRKNSLIVLNVTLLLQRSSAFDCCSFSSLLLKRNQHEEIKLWREKSKRGKKFFPFLEIFSRPKNFLPHVATFSTRLHLQLIL